MLKKLKFITFFTFLALLASNEMSAQLRVTKVTDADMLAGKKGIVYTLPRTVIHVDLTVAKTQQVAGPLAEYAKEYLGIDDAITKSAVSYAIGESILWAANEPDPGAVYLIEKEDKSQGEIWISFGKTTPVMTFEKFDKTVSPKGFDSWNENLFAPQEPAGLFRKYTDSPDRQVTDTIIRKVSIDTLVFEEMILRHSLEEYSNVEKAKEAAGRIKQIEQDKYNLMVGYQETAYSKETLEFMYSMLEKQRLEYLKLFTGVSINESLKFDYLVFPETGKEEQVYNIAGFSKTTGIVAPEGQNVISVSLKSDALNFSTGESEGSQSATGLVYRTPVTVQAVLSFQGKELDSKRMEVLQLGPLMTLPAEFKRVEMDTETGTLKSVVLE